ncbi:Peroxisomal biogenesis factor 3 [Pseudolycoriella hygida]|uniref:Peroxisomal biogenesis factor 3 n=1 Tax=Pseudolycoriella hygida TaxID=35572 RepID=A0A9Q0RVE8_9DIPT|nr:Peroxisomal biogenesis factor 3 [Pseudolycoriella hygida]
MFSSVKDFLSRHKRKFIVTGVIVGGGALALQYAQRKLRQFQEDQTREFIQRTRRSQHFESTERTCNQAIMGVAPALCDKILKRLNTDTILQQIRESPEKKVELWNELKVQAFTRLTTLVYACSMLVVSLRIQLNILGGYLYKDTIAEGQTELTKENQQRYLSLSQHLLEEGIEKLVALIERKVREVLGLYELKQNLSLADTEQIFWSIQMAVNSDVEGPNSSLGKYILQEELNIPNETELLTKMYTETLDMLESDEASSLNTYNVSRGFSIVMDSIADYYYEPLKKTGMDIVNENSIAIPSTSKADLNVSSTLPNINSVQLPLAKLIPIVNGLGGKHFNVNVRPASLSTSLVTLYLVSDKVKLLGANVYEVFSC